MKVLKVSSLSEATIVTVVYGDAVRQLQQRPPSVRLCVSGTA